MRCQRSRKLPAGRLSDEVQFLVLALLLDRECPELWSVQELARELDCEVEDAVVSLDAAGLVHRCGEFVFASRSASRFCQLLRE